MTVPNRNLVSHRDVRELRGPLMVLGDAHGVGWDEFADVDVDGGRERHALVLEVNDDQALLQVLEGTDGMRLGGISVRFKGQPLHIPVGPEWLGRACNGRGEPLDGGPPITADTVEPVGGWPLNPVYRIPPMEAVITGISAIDALTTLVRGQKLPIFSVPGLPHLALATQIAAQSRTGGRNFRVVFAAMGMTHADIAYIRDRLEERSGAGELVLLLNAADDPVIERILTPRIALSIAEHLAYEEGSDVLVVMSDMTSYAEAVREVSAARKEIPARRGYPGYLYSDLATLYERCGRVQGREGSVTIVPVLTMPSGDMTHPVPDLTGYITEGQIVLSPEVGARDIYPPVDVLSSLSRLMRSGAGGGRTREDHLDVAAQVLAAMARARQASELAELVGQEALGEADRAYIEFRSVVEQKLLNQGVDEYRSLDETLGLAWEALGVLPRRELSMLAPELLDRYLPGPLGGARL
ncbi:V-type ATP synthase subunit B [Arthrobacter gandavensis]|uniref:V-type ATP synthase subunit B n=1 Tax=Arthrobacter gandavensis TaxID=169960 RepID=UPI0018904EC9|nr:V-type ATP synthase subunit B [Arthrobacter gandavensis]MBF4994958.1 V-type ATP synthase subunit B [Arthrobacter gandavensis]